MAMTLHDRFNRVVLPGAINVLGAVEVHARELIEGARVQHLPALVRRRPVMALGLATLIGVVLERVRARARPDGSYYYVGVMSGTQSAARRSVGILNSLEHE